MAHTSGGRVSTVIGGRNYHARGVITLNPSNINVSAGANQDGTVFRTVAPKPRTVEMTFDRFIDNEGQPLKWAENIMELDNLGITFVETDGKVTHVLSGGFFTGEPQHDTSTGEISGLGLAAETYKTLKN